MKFRIGERAEICANGDEGFLKHFLPIGEIVEIISEYKLWYEPAYYVKKFNGNTYSEPILERELTQLNYKPMNIIEAIQQAENGKLITEGILKLAGKYIEYKGGGVFHEHKIIADEKTEFVGSVHSFSMQQILARDWTIVHSLKLKG